MGKYRIETDNGTYEIETDDVPQNLAAPATMDRPKLDMQPSATPGGVARGMFDQASRAIGTAASDLNPMNLVRAARHPLDTASAMYDATGDAVHRTREAFAKGDYGETAKSALGAIPVIGPAAETIARDATEGRIPEAIGHAASIWAGGKLPKVIGSGARALAEPLAESAVGVKAVNRAYGKTPGAAVLDETSGLRPAKVADSARAKLGQLTPELESRAAASTTPVRTTPAIDVIDQAIAKAKLQNDAQTLAQLEPMRDQLTKSITTKLPIAPVQTPSGLLNLKRGFGEANVNNWNPATMHGVKGTAARAYHALGEEFERGVPGAESLNNRISSLIPVAERAESTSLNAGLVQQIMHKLVTPTGALVGGFGGYQMGGIPGAIGGVVLPTLIGSPTAKMAAARTLNSIGKPLRAPLAAKAGTAVPLLKERKEKK